MDEAVAITASLEESAVPEMDADERVAFIAAVQEGILQADAGLGRPFEELVPWLLSWGKEDGPPPPA